MAEVTCPINKRWLKGVADFLPPEIFDTSKLSKFKSCLEETKR